MKNRNYLFFKELFAGESKDGLVCLESVVALNFRLVLQASPACSIKRPIRRRLTLRPNKANSFFKRLVP